ncbi:MAG: hypothetical protein MUO51_00390 [Woeseiaceae bacterium]|nr:hypothetical protein [Woeseiaceae bacterium]
MSLEALSGVSNRSLLLVHGRGFKPSADMYMDLSMAALRSGIERDFSTCVDSFDAVQKNIAWYGDLNAEIILLRGKQYDESLDIGDRRRALATLREISVRKRFGIRQYDQLPGKSAIPEAIVGVLAPLLGALGLCVPLIRCASRDFARYFDRKSDYAMKVRQRLRQQLCTLMDRGDRIVLMSHGTGSVVAYDVLWQLSHDPDLKEKYGDKKVELWVTLGAPLGDSKIQKRLLGAKEKPATKFPVNVIAWHNVAAEDDYTCHDNTLADDFKMMLKQRVVSAVYDHKIFNLAVRYGRSNPHSSIGYYIHPRVSKILADWLQDGGAGSSPIYTL